LRLFPPDNPWNQDVSAAPVDPNSAALIASIGLDRGLHPDFGTVWDGAPNGIPYTVVDSGQAKVPVSFEYADESDLGPYPLPPDVPIEGGPASAGDRHVLVVDRDAGVLYELFAAYPDGSGAGWRLLRGDLRPQFERSPASRLDVRRRRRPAHPAGLVRYDEVVEQAQSSMR